MQRDDGDLVHHVEVSAVGGGELELLCKEMHNRIAHDWLELSTLAVFIDRSSREY